MTDTVQEARNHERFFFSHIVVSLVHFLNYNTVQPTKCIRNQNSWFLFNSVC